jgi:hypothetical protein
MPDMQYTEDVMCQIIDTFVLWVKQYSSTTAFALLFAASMDSQWNGEKSIFNIIISINH